MNVELYQSYSFGGKIVMIIVNVDAVRITWDDLDKIISWMLSFDFEIEGLKYLNFGDGVCKITESNGCHREYILDLLK